MKFEYIEWDREKIDGYLKDKFFRRNVDASEYEFITQYLRELKPKVIIDVGCFMGVSTYILGTSSPNLEHLYAIENIDSPTFVPYYYVAEERYFPKEDYAKFAPKGAIFKTHGFENDLGELIRQYNGDVFVFLDSVKTTPRVLEELKICYDNKAKHIAMHDTSKYYKQVRRAMKRAINLGWYKLIKEVNVELIDIRTKGLSILDLV